MGFVRRNSAIFRTLPQGGLKDAGTVPVPASFKPPCGCVRKIAELRRTKPAGDCAISPHVRFACLFLNPTQSNQGKFTESDMRPFAVAFASRNSAICPISLKPVPKDAGAATASFVTGLSEIGKIFEFSDTNPATKSRVEKKTGKSNVGRYRTIRRGFRTAQLGFFPDGPTKWLRRCGHRARIF